MEGTGHSVPEIRPITYQLVLIGFAHHTINITAQHGTKKEVNTVVAVHTKDDTVQLCSLALKEWYTHLQ